MSFEAQPQLMSLLSSSRPERDNGPDQAVRQHHFKIRAADSSRQLGAASMLIEKMYATRGYQTGPLKDDGTANRITLVASDECSAIGTLTVRFDSAAGLLGDELFLDEINALRDAGRQVCEFTKLAMDRGVGSRRALAALFHVAYIYARRVGRCNNLLIEVNPRHVRYYEAMLGFKALGPQRLNPRVNAPAVLLSLDLSYAHDQISKFGGRPDLAATERSAYPYFFSVAEEAGIVGKVRSAGASRDPAMDQIQTTHGDDRQFH